MIIKEFNFGETSKGEEVKGVNINNGKGVDFSVINWGATLISVQLKDREGKFQECSLGFDNIADYEKKSPYYGATIGRVGNRISNGSFVIDGESYNLAINANGVNSLHGGLKGFDKVLWDISFFLNDDIGGVVLKYTSPDGEEGFPGELDVTVTYSLNLDNELAIDYRATTTKKTPVNLTNHTYWNLSGDLNSISNHRLQIEADSYLPINDVQIPTGEIRSVDGSKFDFREKRAIEGSFDHNFNLSLRKKEYPENRVYLEDIKSGRTMEILTTEPGVQLYTTEKSICLETQMYPDAINRENFQSIILEPGEEYIQTTIHKFGIMNS